MTPSPEANQNGPDPGAGAPGKARRISVPTAVKEAHAFARDCDYAVAYELAVPASTVLTAEQWSRSIFEKAAMGFRWFLVTGWTALTIRLQPRRAPSRILGWQIESNEVNSVITVVHAWIGITSWLLVTTAPGTVTLGSFVSYTRHTKLPARVVWSLTVPLHERVLPHLLNVAAQRQLPS